MATKLSKQSIADREAVGSKPVKVDVSPWATTVWGIIRSDNKAEIIAALEKATPGADASTKSIDIDGTTVKVRDMPSGFRVFYEPSEDRNTIVAVLPPHVVRAIEG